MALVPFLAQAHASRPDKRHLGIAQARLLGSVLFILLNDCYIVHATAGTAELRLDAA